MNISSIIFRFVILSLCIDAVGCTDVKEIPQSFKELSSLRSQVIEKFHEADVSLNLSKGRHLMVSLVNSPLKQLSKTEKQLKAREIASFVAKSYKGKEVLDSVSVVFLVRKSFFIFSFTDSSDSYRFKSTELLAPEQPPAGEATASQRILVEFWCP